VSYLYGTNVEQIYSLSQPVTKNTYTTAAPLSVPNAAATQSRAVVPITVWGASPVGKGLLVHASGTIATTSAATFIGQIGLDPTPATLANAITYWPILAPTAAITCLWDLEVWYTCTQGGQFGQFQANGNYWQSTVATGVLNSTGPQNVRFQALLTGISTEVPFDVELFGTWSASAAGNTTTVQQMQVFGLN
jgi:hypothetical protein